VSTSLLQAPLWHYRSENVQHALKQHQISAVLHIIL